MIDTLVEIDVVDDRKFRGVLLAIDNRRNVVLGDAVEYSLVETKPFHRKVNMVMISGDHIVRVYQ